MKRTVIAPVVAIVLLGGCQLKGLEFRQDRRIQVVAPDYRELVELPVTVDWEVTDGTLAGNIGEATQFGVYVDIDPQPPGESLDYFGRDDPVCMKQQDCPDEKYLRQRGIHTTSETEMTFAVLPLAPGVELENGDPDFHEVTVVLLDEHGVRIGEGAWAITFEVQRGGD